MQPNIQRDLFPQQPTKPFTEKFSNDGRPHALLMPGIGLAGGTVGRLTSNLNELGVDSVTWGWYVNTGPTNKTIKRIEETLKQCFADAGEPIWLVAHSLGASMSLYLARKYPEMVAGVIMVAGSAQLDLAKAHEQTNLGFAVDVMEKHPKVWNAEIMKTFRPENEYEPLKVTVVAVACTNDGIMDGHISLVDETNPGYLNVVLDTNHGQSKKLRVTAEVAAHVIKNGIETPFPSEIASQFKDEKDIVEFEPVELSELVKRLTQEPRDLLHAKVNAAPDLVAHKTGNILFGNPFGPKQSQLLTAGPNFDR